VTAALPFLATLALWFASTALIVWLANRPSTTFGFSLLLGGAAGVFGLVLILLTADVVTPAAHYAGLCRRVAGLGLARACIPDRRGHRATPRPLGRGAGWPRFRAATATVIHHEIALAATALPLAGAELGRGQYDRRPRLWLVARLRLSAKLNIFLGVPNLSDEMLPRQLHYLKSYFGAPRLHAALVASLIGSIALAAWLGARALAMPADVGAALLFALAALGALEHLFLALPVRDGALWRWAIPARPKSWGGGYGL
jgi:putative photosynthetic complex assembly protein 2